MIAILLAGVQIPVADYQEIVIDRPLMAQDYPKHYTHYELRDKLLDVALKQWSHYNVNEKKSLLNEMSKVTESEKLSSALVKLFKSESNELIQHQILSTLTYMKQSASSLNQLKDIAKDEKFSMGAFAVLARNLKSDELKSYLKRSDAYIVTACLAENVNDPQVLINALSQAKEDYQKSLILRQLARISQDSAYAKCETDFHRSQFTAASRSKSFLIKQAKTKKFANQALMRMKELGWNSDFNQVAKDILLSSSVEVQVSACALLAENKVNMPFLLSKLNGLPEVAGVVALDVFVTNAVPETLQKQFCQLKKNADVVNIKKLGVMEDQALVQGQKNTFQLIRQSQNPALVEVGLRYLGVMKTPVDKSFIAKQLKHRDTARRQGAVFYLASSAKSTQLSGLVKYTQGSDMAIRKAFYDGAAHNPTVNFSKLITPGLKNRKDAKHNPQPSSEVRSYMIWAMTNSNHVHNQNLFELKKLLTEKLVKVPMSENVFDPSYVRENAYLCLAHWASKGSKEGTRMFSEVQEFVEWQKEEGLEYSESFDQVLDMTEALLQGKKINKKYFYTKALSIRLIDSPIR